MNVVIVSPNAVDARLTVDVLEKRGMGTTVCDRLGQLDALVHTAIGCVVVVEEALVPEDVDAFQDALQAQPPWSDLPVLLIASRGGSLSELADAVFSRSGNVTVLQRPLHTVSLISAVNVALRSRARQLEVRKLLAQRDAAVKERDEFLAMLAHELRNPLAPIRNAVFLMNTLEYTDPLFLKCRAMIEKQARHITRLVDDLLDVSRLELRKVELRMQSVDLNEMIGSAAEACVPATSARRQTVNLRPSSHPLRVRADPVRLEQAICNLVLNAAKFTPEGGTIDVEVASPGSEAVISVTDNGMGIDPAMLDSIFDLFKQGSVSMARTEGGLGIGLTLVKRLMELHGGSVRAFSEGLGMGTRLEIRLPIEAAPVQSESRGDHGPAPFVKKRVLVVEDGADARDSLGMLIHRWQHEVIYASSGPEGLARAREERPDVAVIDIGLPGFDGYQLARKIREEDSAWARQMRLIALTGYGQAADRVKALESGFDMHVLKPVDPAVLREMLASATASSVPR